MKKQFKLNLMIMRNLSTRKKLMLTTIIAFGVTALHAQLKTADQQAIKATVEEIGRSIYVVIYSIAALAGLVGGVTVSIAYWNDKQNAGELLKKFLAGFIILLLLGGIIQLFTGVNLSGSK